MNFIETEDNKIQATTCIDAAQHYICLLIGSNIKGYSQLFPRKENNVADALSLGLATHTDILCFHYPDQMLVRFEISPLSSGISLRLISLL